MWISPMPLKDDTQHTGTFQYHGRSQHSNLVWVCCHRTASLLKNVGLIGEGTCTIHRQQCLATMQGFPASRNRDPLQGSPEVELFCII
ncbi:hypothetical protein BDZ94DRAFT_1254346 [Collybia nuda]|uniref:Uncharacterized protein n=1 Tax=Collybia nuda TaxID=64659 RepID=A0A9P6CGQ9_9AGAR|nr:hypothetical protein BDZ94DRAFT_1254346 [Collybia nuda]